MRSSLVVQMCAFACASVYWWNWSRNDEEKEMAKNKRWWWCSSEIRREKENKNFVIELHQVVCADASARLLCAIINIYYHWTGRRAVYLDSSVFFLFFFVIFSASLLQFVRFVFNSSTVKCNFAAMLCNIVVVNAMNKVGHVRRCVWVCSCCCILCGANNLCRKRFSFCNHLFPDKRRTIRGFCAHSLAHTQIQFISPCFYCFCHRFPTNDTAINDRWNQFNVAFSPAFGLMFSFTSMCSDVRHLLISGFSVWFEIDNWTAISGGRQLLWAQTVHGWLQRYVVWWDRYHYAISKRFSNLLFTRIAGQHSIPFYESMIHKNDDVSRVIKMISEITSGSWMT